MRLDEIAVGDPEAQLRADVEEALNALGLEAGDAYLGETERGRKVYVATTLGLYVGDYGADEDGAISLHGTLTGWVEVAGARMITTWYGQDPEKGTLIVEVANPPVREVVHGLKDVQAFRALRELGRFAMTHQRGGR